MLLANADDLEENDADEVHNNVQQDEKETIRVDVRVLLVSLH